MREDTFAFGTIAMNITSIPDLIMMELGATATSMHLCETTTVKFLFNVPGKKKTIRVVLGLIVAVIDYIHLMSTYFHFFVCK